MYSVEMWRKYGRCAKMARGEMYVLADPIYESSSWFTRCFAGLRAEAARCDVSVIKVEDTQQIPAVANVRTCVLFCSDVRWVRKAVAALYARGVRSVLAGAQPDAFYGVSGTIIDRRLLMEDTVRYFIAHGRRRLACLGSVASDVNDAIRVAAFHNAMRAAGLKSRGDDIFSAGHGIDECARRMLERAGEYDGALCVNDQVAVRLIALAREKGVRVPEDLFVSGSGNLLVGQLCRPALTTTDLDYYQMGRKTVGIWQYIDKTPDVKAMTVTIQHRLIPRGSTACLPVPDEDVFSSGAAAAENPIADAMRDNVERLENCLFHCDALDLRIISGIARGSSMEKIAADLFVALGTVNYRAKKLYRAMNVSCRRELEKVLAQQIAAPEALEEMARNR